MKRIDHLRLRLLAARVCLAVLAVAGAVAAYPAHRSFISLIGGICLAYVLAFFAGEVERTKRDITDEQKGGAS